MQENKNESNKISLKLQQINKIMINDNGYMSERKNLRINHSYSLMAVFLEFGLQITAPATAKER